MSAMVFRWMAIVLNACAACWWFSYALVWGPNDFAGGAVASTPPIVAVVALIWANARERRMDREKQNGDRVNPIAAKGGR